MGWIERERDWLEEPGREPAAAPAPPPQAPAEVSQEPIVRWVPVRCPVCHGRDVPVIGTPRGVPGMRYHRCRDCDTPFKSFEVDPAARR